MSLDYGMKVKDEILRKRGVLSSRLRLQDGGEGMRRNEVRGSIMFVDARTWLGAVGSKGDWLRVAQGVSQDCFGRLGVDHGGSERVKRD